MPREFCPHCSAGQELESPSPGAGASHTCTSCGKIFVSHTPSAAGGSTQKLGDPAATQAVSSPGVAQQTPGRIGPYEIRGTIGVGGMGVVYRGWDARLNRPVAVKTLKSDLARDQDHRERFLREARAAAALSHPNVTQIYFIGEEGGQPFFAMECLEGKSLEAVLREEGKLAPDRAIALVRQAAAGLKAAAARGIIHRDVKPSNLVLTPDGVLKVTDFGLAKLTLSDTGLTMSGVILGSPNYMAPEQASGGSSDIRSDIYSLGATLYEMVTGHPPFEGPTPVSIILKHAREPLRNPRQFSPDLPYPLTLLLQRMLAKRPEDRPKDYDALIRELDRFASRGTSTAAAQDPPSVGLSPNQTLRTPTSATQSSGSIWILFPILVLTLLAGWGLLKHSLRRAEARAATPPLAVTRAAPTALPPETRVLTSSTEMTPPSLGPISDRREVVGLPPRLRQLREAARSNLQFVENRHEITPDGHLRVVGSVSNTGPGNASAIRVRIVLLDAAGQALGTTEVPLSPAFLGALQTGTFDASFPDPHQPVDIRTELSWNS